MSENADLVRKFYETAGSGDFPGALALLAPDVQWIEMDGFPTGGTYKGPAEVAAVLQRVAEAWDDFRVETEEFVDGGERVAMVGYYSGTAKKTGKPMRVRVLHLWRVRAGQLVGFEQFVDTLRVDEALR